MSRVCSRGDTTLTRADRRIVLRCIDVFTWDAQKTMRRALRATLDNEHYSEQTNYWARHAFRAAERALVLRRLLEELDALESPMSLDKAVEHGKEHRAPYRRSRRFDRSCRHGGSCNYCRSNRTIGNQKLADKVQEGLADAVDPRGTEANWACPHCKQRPVRDLGHDGLGGSWMECPKCGSSWNLNVGGVSHLKTPGAIV